MFEYFIILVHGFFVFMATFGFIHLIEKYQRWKANRRVLRKIERQVSSVRFSVGPKDLKGHHDVYLMP